MVRADAGYFATKLGYFRSETLGTCCHRLGPGRVLLGRPRVARSLERRHLGHQGCQLGVLLVAASLQRGDLLAVIRVIRVGRVECLEPLDERESPLLGFEVNGVDEVFPEAIKVLEHENCADLVIPTEVGADDERLHSRDGLALPAQQVGRIHADIPYRGIRRRRRHDLHAGSRAPGGPRGNADRSSPLSRALAGHVATALKVETEGERAAGQTSGGRFEEACANFLEAAFSQLGHLRPGEWSVHKVPSRGSTSGVARYEQYAHLVDLVAAVESNPSLAAVLGNADAIAPDVVVSRAPVSDEEINTHRFLVDDTVATHASLRASVQPNEILHAVVSCKWTLRSDRAQNARSEALNLIRNRNRLPHVVVVTGEPTPVRISSLALGTGDIDCVYHFALPELVDAAGDKGGEDTKELLGMMIEGKRVKDISDLPLDLAV